MSTTTHSPAPPEVRHDGVPAVGAGPSPSTGQGVDDASASTGLRRRALAKGALWAVPTIALSVPAPAYAASRDVYGPTVCDLYYQAGTSSNFQGLSVHLGVSSTSSTIPQGTTFRWAVTLSGYGSGAHGVPAVNYSDNGRWKLVVSPATNPTATTTAFTVVLTVNATSVTLSELNCSTELIWGDSSAVVGGTQVDIVGTASVTGPSKGTVQSSSLSFKVARRYPTNVNQAGRLAHRYLSKSGAQSCYPLIRFVYGAASAIDACGDGHNSTSTIYPGPATDPSATTCVRLKTPSPSTTGQGDLPAKC